MIYVCSNCGVQLVRPIADGVAGCHRCNHIIDSSLFNKILSFRWYVKDNNIHSFDQIPVNSFSFKEQELELMTKLVMESDYSHEELYHCLNNMGISKEIT